MQYTNRFVFAVALLSALIIFLIPFRAESEGTVEHEDLQKSLASLHQQLRELDLQLRSLQGKEVSVEEKEKDRVYVWAQVSAFTASVDETDATPTVTASGSIVNSETVACPRRYAFGTVVEIEGKRYRCLDRMHRRYDAGNYFDIYLPTKSQAIQWGRKWTQVEIFL